MPFPTHTVTIKNITFGKGQPKICLPIVDRSKEDILKTVERYEDFDHWDVVELRLDFYEDLLDPTALTKLLERVRSHTKHLILATIRTKKEGGEVTLTKQQYSMLVKTIILSECVDLIDIELSQGETAVIQMVDGAHKHYIKTIISAHNFERTPSSLQMKQTLKKMKEVGGDILKLAVMPHDVHDVVRLLDVTHEARVLNTPVITMAMGELGVLSRVAGETFGSAMTFATLGKASAPGQIPLDQMYDILKVLHHDQS